MVPQTSTPVINGEHQRVGAQQHKQQPPQTPPSSVPAPRASPREMVVEKSGRSTTTTVSTVQ